MNTTSKPKQKAPENFSGRLLTWYRTCARKMPWRVSPENHALGERQDPYKVWLSEIMLQQTQVTTVRDYYLKFIAMWPTVDELADADLEDVLKAWAGLGYYSRARNLKKCADKVVAEHGGRFPHSYDVLKTLPGIGDYTASAIASIAFDEAVPVMDGNVERVLARHRRIEAEFPKAKPHAKQFLNELLDPKLPGEFAQAMMDLGATVCTPRNPSCKICPVDQDCKAFKTGDPENYPRKQPKKKKPRRKGAAFVIRNSNNQVFLCKRENSGLLAGMTQVPTTGWDASQDGKSGQAALPFKGNWRKTGSARHTFTHFHLELEVWRSDNTNDVPIDGWWCEENMLGDEALPTVMRKVLAVALGGKNPGSSEIRLPQP